jgi:hypothetical protein
MKNLFTLLFVAGIATGAFATNENLAVQVRQIATAKVAVAFNEAPQGPVIVKISDSKDRVIMRDKINTSEAFAKKYDLNSLPEGIYTVEVTDAENIVKSASIDTHAPQTPGVFTRVSQLNENQYRLLVSSMNAKDVTVMIYDGANLIHSEKIDNPQGLHKIFTFDRTSTEGINFRVKTAAGFETYVSSL